MCKKMFLAVLCILLHLISPFLANAFFLLVAHLSHPSKHSISRYYSLHSLLHLSHKHMHSQTQTQTATVVFYNCRLVVKIASPFTSYSVSICLSDALNYDLQQQLWLLNWCHSMDVHLFSQFAYNNHRNCGVCTSLALFLMETILQRGSHVAAAVPTKWMLSTFLQTSEDSNACYEVCERNGISPISKSRSFSYVVHKKNFQFVKIISFAWREVLRLRPGQRVLNMLERTYLRRSFLTD